MNKKSDSRTGVTELVLDVGYFREVVTAYPGSTTAYVVGWSHSDNKASLSSSKTAIELSTGTELGNFKNNIPHHKSLLITGIWL